MQDTFTQTWQYIVRGNEVDNLQAFLYKVSRNLIINYGTRTKKTESLDDISEQSGFEIEDGYNSNSENASEGRMLLEFIHTLENNMKELLLLRYVEELPIKEIAKIIGLSSNNTTVKLHRATKKLRELYESKTHKYE